MKDYIKSFLLRFKYSDSDSEFLLSAWDSIEADHSASFAFKHVYDSYCESVDIDYNASNVAIQAAAREAGVHDYTATFLMYIVLSQRLEQLYIQRGIDNSIFYESMKDLSFKLKECKEVKGIVGTFTNWFPGFYKLTRFALGRLQFELTEAKYDYTDGVNGVKVGDTVINMHIPSSGEPLTPEAADESFALAKEFFRDSFDTEYIPFVCSSWLLHPINDHILPEKSNIRAFKNRFVILSHKLDLGENLWRFFGTDEKNPEKLPANTSLRRAYVEHLKAGGRTGSAYGIFFK